MDSKEIVNAALLARMNGKEPFTLSEMAAIVRREVGIKSGRLDGRDPERVADAFLQKHRKAGVIQHARVGRQTVWSRVTANAEA